MTVEISAVGGAGTVSPTSPLGSALLGRKVGDTVDVAGAARRVEGDGPRDPLRARDRRRRRRDRRATPSSSGSSRARG